jgi:glutathione peroxidase
MPDIYDFTARAADGHDVPIAEYRGRVLLIVNTASKCGFTPQYEGLQALQKEYGDKGLTVLGFPCDQFMHQEPGSDAEIQNFCSTKYDVTFPVFSKVEVNGPKTNPLWAFLKEQKSGLLGGGIKWNFTKFLVDRTGRVVDRFPPTTTPSSLKSQVEKLLAAA